MRSFIFFISFYIVSNSLFAQRKSKDFSFSDWGSAITVDGKIDDWQSSQLNNVDSIWRFGVTYDDKNIYFAVEVRDPMLKSEAARNGISININMEGKKKEGIQLVFPMPDKETIRAMRSDEELKPEEISSELIKRTRGYYVKGFPTIIDGFLSLNNSYGIFAVAKTAPDSDLIYEAVIPLDLLVHKQNAENIALQVAINNRWSMMQAQLNSTRRNSRPIMGYYGYMAPSAPRVKSPIEGKMDAWIVDKLKFD